MNSNWSIIVSCSIHDGQEDLPSNETVHMMSHPRCVITEEQARAFKERLEELMGEVGIIPYKREQRKEIH